MQNLVIVSHTVWAHVAWPKNGGRWAPVIGGVADPLETRPFPTCVRLPCRTWQFWLERFERT